MSENKPQRPQSSGASTAFMAVALLAGGTAFYFKDSIFSFLDDTGIRPYEVANDPTTDSSRGLYADSIRVDSKADCVSLAFNALANPPERVNKYIYVQCGDFGNDDFKLAVNIEDQTVTLSNAREQFIEEEPTTYTARSINEMVTYMRSVGVNLRERPNTAESWPNWTDVSLQRKKHRMPIPEAGDNALIRYNLR